MFLHRTFVLLAVAAFTASCGSDASKSGQRGPESTLAPSTLQHTASGAPIAPPDARMTLFCAAVGGPNHVAQSKQLKDQLIASTGMKDFYLIHGEEQSTLYYGYYKDFSDNRDPKEKLRADNDLKRIASLTDTAHNPLFHGALFVDVNTPDPQGPPEWNLINTPPDRFWTLQIGAYVDSPQRKQYAVDAVRQARAMGIEAYYYHGPNVSSVCVGAFPKEALKETGKKTARTYNSDETMVVIAAPRPKNTAEDQYIMQDGKRTKVTVVAPDVEPVDPKLIELMKRFPHSSVNGQERVTRSTTPKTGRTIEVYDPSIIVEIKRPGANLGIPQPGTPTIVPEPSPAPAPAPRPGAGRLRGLGDE
jgi:hypothetical protein